jgi:hypothetical protein
VVRLGRVKRVLLITSLVVACGSKDDASTDAPVVSVRMDFTRSAGLYAAPFPSDDLARADGTIALDRFPNPTANPLVGQALGLLRSDAHGFATSSGVFFSLTGAVEQASLPALRDSTADGASVFLMSVDASAPDRLRRTPVEVVFNADGGPYGDANQLTVLPLQGVPLRPHTTYAAVITRRVRDTSGRAIEPSSGWRELVASTTRPRSYDLAFAALAEAKVPLDDVVGLAAFTTDALGKVHDAMLARPRPAPTKPFQRTDTFDGYCVYATTIKMPDYQSGTPPYARSGGTWVLDPSGAPLLQRESEASFVVTVPRRVIPASGLPVVVFVRTGAGGDRPLVDRGRQGVAGGEALVKGSGPAMDFAAVGFGGVSIDGPLGGLRNPNHQDEQFLVFNIENAGGLRDNVRESAAELSVVPHILEGLTIDVKDCPGASSASGATTVGFDRDHVALMGHSMGGTIAPLVLAAEPRYGLAILSGAGGSWIENIVYKQKPLAVRPIMELILGYTNVERTLTAYDPAASLFQWAAEAADPQVYDERIIRAPVAGMPARHVLMLQGMVDHYIMPPIANTTSMSLGLDLGGDALDEKTPEVTGMPTAAMGLSFVGRGKVALPASANVKIGTTTATAIVVQHPADGIEDGHEIAFQTDGPKHQYRCFLASWLKGGTPVVVAPGAEDAPCE